MKNLARLATVAVVYLFVVPAPTLPLFANAATAAVVVSSTPETPLGEEVNAEISQNIGWLDQYFSEPPRLPENPVKLNIKHLGVKTVSAYNVGDPFQTDNSPCTAANGENICLALELGYQRCAANFVPFGTVLEVETIGQCLVTDRMNSRFGNHVDIAMKKDEKKEALKFGRRKLKIKIISKINQI